MSLKSLLRHAFLITATLLPGRYAAQHSSPDSTAHHATITVDADAHATSSPDEGHGSIEKFNAGKLIMDHIGDEHGWHLWGHTSLPLPVILYNSERGLSLFSSGRFDHGHKTYGGYALHEGHVVAVDAPDGSDAHHAAVNEDLAAATVDLSITKNVATLLIVSALLLWVFISVARAYTRRAGQAPTGLQNLVEPIILFVRDDLAKSAIGHRYERYLPYLLTAFFFIFFSNLLGLVPFFPGGANLTGNIAVTVVLAVITFLIVTFSGNKHYWHHIFAMPGVPGWVLAILTPVEILGMFLKPFVLAIRLFANITAGHIIALSFFSLIFVFGETSAGAGYGVAIGSWLFTVFMFMLELLVAFIQAYVFTFLSAMYIGAAVEEPHHH
ncbi:MAG TPA: F0F1 ATP synthase subunit A [Flavobacteriales bacterium]|nr:F0F1 ATP synthase subunit A [Flavobacteriales bacterium]HMR26211.1 F0F1 ATP synthase subunit A [Flavobacteriales bacterium]